MPPVIAEQNVFSMHPSGAIPGSCCDKHGNTCQTSGWRCTHYAESALWIYIYGGYFSFLHL